MGGTSPIVVIPNIETPTFYYIGTLDPLGFDSVKHSGGPSPQHFAA